MKNKKKNHFEKQYLKADMSVRDAKSRLTEAEEFLEQYSIFYNSLIVIEENKTWQWTGSKLIRYDEFGNLVCFIHHIHEPSFPNQFVWVFSFDFVSFESSKKPIVKITENYPTPKVLLSVCEEADQILKLKKNAKEN